MTISDTGRPAITHWELRERFGNYSLMYYQLETGRTHQIRVHSAYMGNPIVGDPLYSAGHALKVNLTGQVLHACKLTVAHPITGEIIEAIAPMPNEFKTLLNILRQRS
jgi:23S rRNA pseudouridine1911/1915/1917 synthase